VSLALLPAAVTITAGDGGNNAIRGGRLWDKWWVEIGIDPPAGDHPLYPGKGTRSGSTTFRCKECHGWDYKGAAGAYGPGSSHYTGIPGVFGSTMTWQEMFDLVKFDDPPFGHGFGAWGMTDQDIADVVEFVQTLLVDTDDYIDGDEQFIGDETVGEDAYETGGGVLPIGCTVCHGPNGTWLNFGAVEDPEWVGTIAVHNPWEMLHKVRFGQPGGLMPAWLDYGGSDQGAADIGKYSQLLPTERELVLPESLEVVFGAHSGGDVGDLDESDDVHVTVDQRAAFSVILPLIRMDVAGVASRSSALDLTVTLEASATALPAQSPQKLSLYDYNTTTWELVDERIATPGDSVVWLLINVNPDRFIEPGTDAMQMRVEWFDPGDVFFVAWMSRTDQAIWRLAPP
jgi:thiosulfate dehydrogenase